MGRIDRYILSQMLLVFGLSALVLVSIYWVNRAVLLFDQLIADGQNAWVFLEFTALALPGIVKLVLPLAAYVAVLIAVNRLAGDSELTVLRATGASPWRLARPVLAFGLIAGALVAVLAHQLEPAAAQRLDRREAEIAQTATARLLREGEFVSAAEGVTLYVREITARGELRGLLLEDRRDPARPVTYTAAEAYLVGGPAGPQLVMVEGLIQRYGSADGRLVTTAFADLAYDLAPLLDRAGGGARDLRSLPTAALLVPGTDVLAETGQPVARLRIEALERLAETLLPPVAVLIALGAMLQGEFSRFGLWPQIGLAVLLAILLKAVEAAAVQAARDDPGLWPVLFAPAAGGAAAAAALLWRTTRPRRLSRPAEARP